MKRLLLTVLIVSLLIAGCGVKREHHRGAELIIEDVHSAADGQEIRRNTYDSLSVPTQVNKIGDLWFIVDCYHDQVIYSRDMGVPLGEWMVMTDEMSRGHTVAGDGIVYLVDDTENERIMVFERSGDKFVFSQVFEGIGDRPHCIIYDDETNTFYAWASTGGKMYLIRRGEDGREVYIADEKYVDSLAGVYVRSFSIIDDEIYFPAANGNIVCVDKESFEVKATYKVPDAIAGMVQLSRIDDMFYLTVSTDLVGFQDNATIVRFKTVGELAAGSYEDVYESFVGGGTPYYITQIEGSCYLTEHRLPGHSVWRFTADGGVIKAEAVY